MSVEPIVEDGLCRYDCPHFEKTGDCEAFCLFTKEDIVYYDGFNANCISEE